jgi:hypothetical protein
VQGSTAFSAGLFAAASLSVKECEVCLQTDTQELSG